MYASCFQGLHSHFLQLLTTLRFVYTFVFLCPGAEISAGGEVSSSCLPHIREKAIRPLPLGSARGHNKLGREREREDMY